MNVKIREYDPITDDEKLMALIKSEGEEWQRYYNADNQDQYKTALKASITYVAYNDDELCGYARSINDFNFYTWVVDLLVYHKYRGNSIGKKLLEHIYSNFPEQEVFVMSDVDEYYQKLGYLRVGSIFTVK